VGEGLLGWGLARRQFAPVGEAPYDPAMRRARALALAMVLGATSASAVAQPVVHKEGEYTGVTPGKVAEAASDSGKKKRAIGKATLSWVGFAAKDGGAEVFLQSPTKFEVSQRLEGSVLVVQLAGLTRQVTNTRRPIDTRFFDNPLARITAQPRRGKRGRAIEVRMVFKNPREAKAGTLRTTTEADGLFYAYLSFPEGADSAALPSEPSGSGSSGDIVESLDGAEAPVQSPADSAEDDELPDARPKAKAKTKTKLPLKSE
jgi:hypothetical protein